MYSIVIKKKEFLGGEFDCLRKNLVFFCKLKKKKYHGYAFLYTTYYTLPNISCP